MFVIPTIKILQEKGSWKPVHLKGQFFANALLEFAALFLVWPIFYEILLYFLITAMPFTQTLL